jgi:Domain of unknown function (DUF5658)
MDQVGTLSKSLLLFALNWVDAQLTILWIHLNVATEGNKLMAGLISTSEAQFLVVKLVIGAFAALVLYRGAHIPLARRGMQFVLTVYVLLMVVHGATAFTALGWDAPGAVLAFLASLPGALVAWLT